MRRSSNFERRVMTLAAAALVWLAVPFTSVEAQPPVPTAMSEASPIEIETLAVEPTVVKTGDLITQIYRVRFPDLVGEGKEIIILEDRMVPENLPIHPFEGVSLSVDKRLVDDVHIWDFVYGMRLVTPEKTAYVIPPFSFYYLIRDLGEDIEDAEVQQVDGGGSLVRYVTTMTDEPILDIRDTVTLGRFGGRATMFRTIAWTVAPLPLALWLFMLVRSGRKPTLVSLEQQEEADELERIEAQIPIPPSIWEARRGVTQQLRALEALVPSDNGGLREVERGLLISTRDYLRAELPELHTGDTPKDIQRHIDGLKEGARRRALQTLAARIVAYQSSLELDGGRAIENPLEEAQKLQESLLALRPHVRLWTSLKGLVGQ